LKKILSLFIVLGFALLAFAQQTDKPPINNSTTVAAEKDIIQVDKSDRLEYFSINGIVTQKLIGNVWLHQDSVFMYCDSALIVNRTKLRAFGNVIIQQTDSVACFADSLIYDSAIKNADLYANGDVILKNGQQVLYAWKTLNYNVGERIGAFKRGGKIISDKTQIFSRSGEYFLKSKEAFFRQKVFVADKDFTMKTDTLQYNTADKMAIFLAPTRIEQDSAQIYCERGFYDLNLKKAEFLQHPQYLKKTQKATADTIRYDGNLKEVTLIKNAKFEDSLKVATADTIRYRESKDETQLLGNAFYKDEKQAINGKTIVYNNATESFATQGRSIIADDKNILEADKVDYDKTKGVGLASGNVIWRDTVQNLTIKCEAMDYDKARNYVKTKGKRPLLISLIDRDSLFLSADTLISEKKDSIQTLRAYKDVRIYKSDLQGLSDSLFYSDIDSIFKLFQSPIMWSDSSQFTGDTIHLALANKKLDRIYLLNKAFIINELESELYNQIKGRTVIGYFKQGKINNMKVDGNAESVYYATDDKDAYIGINKVASSEMMIFWGESKVEKIQFFSQPKGNIIPIKKVNNFDEYKMTGFNWSPDKQPKSLDDLFKPKVILPIKATNESKEKESKINKIKQK
jgi:lipopolysaccharide export system protein LptA